MTDWVLVMTGRMIVMMRIVYLYFKDHESVKRRNTRKKTDNKRKLGVYFFFPYSSNLICCQSVVIQYIERWRGLSILLDTVIDNYIVCL